MAIVQGIGLCPIPNQYNLPCGRQIAEGEPIGTVVINKNPLVGHRRCVDGYLARQKKERDMKIGHQQGPGGPIGDPNQYGDAVQSSISLEKEAATQEQLDEAGDRLSAAVRQESQPSSASGTGQLDVGVSPVGGNVPTWTPAEQSEIDRVRDELLDKRRRQEQEKATKQLSTFHIDLSQVPEGAEVISIVLDLSTLRRS